MKKQSTVLKCTLPHKGKLIRAMRAEAGLCQSDLAVVLGVTQTHLSKWECGRSAPTDANMERIAKACGKHLELVALNPGEHITD